MDQTNPVACVVVPCYNEAARFQTGAFLDFSRRFPAIQFVFVNDGSGDTTLDVLNALHARLPDSTHVLNCLKNGGKAEAVRQGIVLALSRMHPQVTGFWDADLATPLEAIPELLGVLDERPDILMVFGARVNLLGRNIRRLAVRHYLGRLFATVVSAMLRMPIYDTQCGAKLFRATLELERALATPFLSRWIFDVEILARLIQQRGGDAAAIAATIYEYPLQQWVDVAGSKVRPRDFLKAMAELVAIYRHYLRKLELPS